MSKDEKCTCKACKNTVFHCQICKFVGFLLPSSSCLLRLPNDDDDDDDDNDDDENDFYFLLSYSFLQAVRKQ